MQKHFSDIVKRLETLASSHSDKAEVITLAKKTYEDREIKVTRNKCFGNVEILPKRMNLIIHLFAGQF